ncbi:hypothetical protein HD599_002568 [Conyzicola lurida]|uniref:Uncharacterized protein n=1 Tax=Conyzicola lurida TaxID=1172621 RepID=A0A841ARP7_9MICO|nr:DUF6716 putative glycosyltransferase [Conyzicola lurida]MBB5844245.1 hypothetical protein [Conyzicola lurida]
MRALALVDTDSYVKWGAALLAQLPAEWERELALVATPAQPSEAQLAAALDGSGFDVGGLLHVELRSLTERVAAQLPDVVIVAMRGPAASVVMRVLADLPHRPVLVSGLPGISIPATWKALFYRGQADLMVLHSKQEIREFTVVGAKRGWNHTLGLATLPFMSDRTAADGRDIVFAVQSIVPDALADRERVLDILLATARHNPDHRVVIKVRALGAEQQTHAEAHSYPDLLAARSDVPSNIVVAAGPMAAALDTARALVTVSSTAVIEAVARHIPVRVIDEFGVSPELINTVFVGSGLFGSGEAIRQLRFEHPRADWLDDNYFHDPADNDWLAALDGLLAARAADALATRPSLRGSAGGLLRRAWERKQAFGSHDRTALGFVALFIGVPARSMALARRRRRNEGEEHRWVATSLDA